MNYETDARFVQGVILGTVDALGDDVMVRLVMLKAKYAALQDAGFGDILRRAFDARASALAGAQEAEDRAYLNALLAGTEDLLSPTVFPRIDPMFDIYGEGTEMLALVEQVADKYSAAVQAATAWALARLAIDDARRGHDRDG